MKSGNPPIYVSERGDIVKLNFSPQVGHEQAGYRPALILSPTRYNQISSLALMCPITNQSKGWSFEVALSEGMQTTEVVLSDQLKSSEGMQTTGVVLSDQLKSFDWRSRQVKFVERVSDEFVLEVLAKVETLLSFTL
jgi:mRNA interferase MazF